VPVRERSLRCRILKLTGLEVELGTHAMNSIQVPSAVQPSSMSGRVVLLEQVPPEVAPDRVDVLVVVLRVTAESISSYQILNRHTYQRR
jgi:hypothetical protein